MARRGRSEGNVDTNIVKYHNPSWSGYEHENAREQIAEYGICYLDDFGRPIDDPEGVRDLAVRDGLVA